MAKTDLTLQLERKIYSATHKVGVFGCFEVTIGWFGKERVDYMTYDTKGIWRCYEIKVSISDFRSKAKKTFCGHYNYFVLTDKLYEKVKDEIPAHIGVYVGDRLVKRPRRQELLLDEDVLKNSMIRSLSRETDKLLKSDNPSFVDGMNRRLNYERKEKERYKQEYRDLLAVVNEKYGREWRYS